MHSSHCLLLRISSNMQNMVEQASMHQIQARSGIHLQQSRLQHSRLQLHTGDGAAAPPAGLHWLILQQQAPAGRSTVLQ
jgi:hypothetical protein